MIKVNGLFYDQDGMITMWIITHIFYDGGMWFFVYKQCTRNVIEVLTPEKAQNIWAMS